MREIKELVEFLKTNQDKNLVLATIVKTEGSTYRKAGAKKLILSQDEACGLISGGCLESDIIHFALQDPSKKRQMTFDTTTDEDRLFGSGIGCQGKITIEFEPVDPKHPNATLQYLNFNQEQDDLNVIVAGSGLDTPPLYELIKTMGWNIQFVEYRSDWLERRLSEGWPIHNIHAKEVQTLIKSPERTALILMSHNYPFDLETLHHIIPMNLPYIGILGPEKRKEQMISDLKKIYDHPITEEQQQHLYGPVGLVGLGSGESAIALSVVSQIQRHFFGD